MFDSFVMIKFVIFQCFVLINYNATAAGVRKVAPDVGWPNYRDFGQLTAVSVDTTGDVYIFHRGDRKWQYDTFNSNERFAKASEGPIRGSTIVVLNTKGDLIANTGKDLFYMPHGITIDNDHNLWVTDVGLHQVIKFPPIEKNNKTAALPLALLTLGEALVPGKDKEHFCKPTSVAVDSHSQDFYVADGYCNSRIIKFDKYGKFLLKWGQQTAGGIYRHIGHYNLNVPHTLTLDEVRGQLIVGDRENSRILCYSLNGEYIHEIDIRSHVYGIAYSASTDKLYAVTGTTYFVPGSGLAYSMDRGNITAVLEPRGKFKNAHDVAVSPDGRYVYVVELDPFILWRFTVGANTTESSKVALPMESAKQEPALTSARGPIAAASGDQEQLGPDSEPSVENTELDDVSTLGANQLALTIVTGVVLMGIIAVSCHMYRKKRTVHTMETRGLILNDFDERLL